MCRVWRDLAFAIAVEVTAGGLVLGVALDSLPVSCDAALSLSEVSVPVLSRAVSVAVRPGDSTGPGPTTSLNWVVESNV